MIIYLSRAIYLPLSPLAEFLEARKGDDIEYLLALAAVVLGEVKDAGESGAYDPPDLSQVQGPLSA